MSDVLFNKAGIKPRTAYTFGDWKQYAVHDDKNIKGFFGKYRWLSNFHECEIVYEGLMYPSSENAYQAAKVITEDRHKLQTCSAAESKKVWKTCKKIDASPEAWEARKYRVMSEILFDKFNRHADLVQKLMDTGARYLEETNHWGDMFWGVDIHGGGKNNLGKLLMEIREWWMAQTATNDDDAWDFHL